MLDIKLLRDDMDAVKAMLKARRTELDLSEFTELDTRRRELITHSDQLKSDRKNLSKQIGQMMAKGEDPSEVKARVGAIGDEIKRHDAEIAEIEAKLNDVLTYIPNMLHESTPIGASEEDNVEVAKWGTPKTFDFEVKDHVAVGTDLGILDFETAVKITGARFVLLKGDAAKLNRALMNFMLDVHTEQGYLEVAPPFMVNSDSMYGTGQFPKMREDSYQLEGTDFHLVPTAEVPVTNIYRDTTLQAQELPIYFQAYTPCFRSEAGSHGRDTRGMIRMHQFEKVELVKFTHPDQSLAELDKLRDDAEELLRRLELPYRVVSLCSGDISFSATKCYDIEVWLPAQQTYREISSCSSFGDFQARRARIRYKDGKAKGLAHTINGSGLPLGRTLVAILENYQEADGRVRIPKVLQPYMNGQEYLQKLG